MNKEYLDGEDIVYMYMMALGNDELSASTWKKLSKVNMLVLGNDEAINKFMVKNAKL